MSSTGVAPTSTLGEEIANSITHGIGVALAVTGLVVMVVFASLTGDPWQIVACSIFGASMVLLYTASTLYHSISQPRAKAMLRVFDHCAIFLLIAGTYTPFTLVNLRGPWGWSLFGVVWGCALAGIVLRTVVGNRWRALSVVLYVVMGWVAVVAVKPLLGAVEPGGLILMVLGGLAYTVGIVFYAWRKLPYHHAIWHGFVLVGSALHFFAILFYVIPFSR